MYIKRLYKRLKLGSWLKNSLAFWNWIVIKLRLGKSSLERSTSSSKFGPKWFAGNVVNLNFSPKSSSSALSFSSSHWDFVIDIMYGSIVSSLEKKRKFSIWYHFWALMYFSVPWEIFQHYGNPLKLFYFKLLIRQTYPDLT